MRDRLAGTGASSTSIPSAGPKIVTFKDEPRPAVAPFVRPNNPAPVSDDDDDDEETTAPKKYENNFQSSSSEEEERPAPKGVSQLVKVMDKKLTQASLTGDKPAVNAVPQGFRPSRQTLRSDDESEDDSVTTITANPPLPPSKPIISQLVHKP